MDILGQSCLTNSKLLTKEKHSKACNVDKTLFLKVLLVNVLYMKISKTD